MMPTTPHQLCPICASHSFHPFLECEDQLVSHKKFLLQKCTTCNLLITTPQPLVSEIGEYYLSENYISHTDGKRNLFDVLYKFVRGQMLKKKRTLIQKCSTGCKILDFGCGTGEFINEMKTHGWIVSGVEPSPVARQRAEEKKLEIAESLDSLKENSFDVISLWHVLEHLHNPNEYLEKFHQLLKQNGTLVVAVPNPESYDASVYKDHWAAYDVPRHLWHFSHSNMKRILDQNGFQLLLTTPMVYDSYYVSLLSESYLHPNRIKILQAAKAFFNGMISNLRAKKSTNYSSLIYIAKRCD